MHEEKLYRAALNGESETVSELLAGGADPNRPSEGEDEGLPLCAAASWDRVEAARALLAAGADVNGREEGGWTALLWAAANGHADTARLLVEAGAEVDVTNDDGDTALTLAARRGALGVVRVLLDSGADATKYDGDGDTPLDVAADWVGVHLESALLDQIGQDDWEYVVARQFAKDGTELVTVAGRSADGEQSEQVQAQRGHAAIATLLEEATGVHAPVDRLVARALAHRDTDEDAETWWIVADALGRRGDEETYEALARLCASEDAREREFGVDAIAQYGVDEDGGKPYLERTLPLLQRMATTESNPQVLRSVLSALGHQGDPRALPQVLDIVNRPGHRRTMTDAIALADVLPPDHAEGLALLVAMTRDDDEEVRDWATSGLASLEADTPEIREALAARLDDTDLRTVAEATRGLAERGDARAARGVERVLAESDDDYARDLVTEARLKLSPDA
ncbi:ankyrin repeat domain-containing protein [Nonomuraea roseoviolacea]|uniref:Ankyrin repeat protein n=1 Tax=Nonomuraea roseoviolacea subsp. carminata TaxID=160689 RepID=A0ABT1K9B3_9ACTN|nr:ankyrin repeat domain-containing protein [Nonomuraea roseoviolacea]MCP2349971.1 ankyrin repeat protein [Nonomuraea roseoviolacea subsp. carminata]